ncbi:MAG: hypothetical protein KYX66_13525 [Blastomonas fulva]|uniref:hypothetical protein n=1 Tax=Blastomonas fulva TaxID=1550728 RepID=UPI0024E26CC7|nr:hypothetical protein [Blastomonas fulva]MDK2757743.1 hypothetical protein [Blastomonas fulva]
MTSFLPVLLIGVASPALAQPAPVAQGIFTNEEQVYFDGEAGRTPPPWTGVQIDPGEGSALVWQTIDRFGAVLASVPVVASADRWRIGDCTMGMTASPDGAMTFSPQSKGCAGAAVPLRIDGGNSLLRRARPFTCWLTVKRDAAGSSGATPESNEDWLFQAGMRTHDQGGRLRLGGGDSGAPEAIIRIRNVVWPEPTRNRPSLVLYVFTPDDTNRAVAYGWADPGAVRVGINQRWMQASCTLDGAE